MAWKKNLVFGLAVACGLLFLLSSITPKFRFKADPKNIVEISNRADFEETVQKANESFAQIWTEKKLAPTGKADLHLIARRISLGLTGTIPSLEELRQFDKWPDDEKIPRWTNYLLSDRRYGDYMAERMARAFVGTDEGVFIVYRRRRFVHWLSDELMKNRRYDDLVRELLTDTGLWTDSPAVNFVSVTADANKENQPDPIRLAARTSRAFLALRIDCLQCHDDNLGTSNLNPEGERREGVQQDFHKLAAFFVDVKTSLRGIQDEKQMRDYKYQLLGDETETMIEESVPFYPELIPAEGTKREKLAGWITHPDNEAFARAIVNRVWGILCSRPLNEPVDDIPLGADCHPVLDLLAKDFAEHDFDFHRLIQLIVSTDAFQRDSKADFEITPEHEKHWAAFPITRLRPEQMAGCIIQASSLSTINARSNVIERLVRFGQERDFVQRFGDVGEDEFGLKSETIPQRLLLMNGEVVSERTEANPLLLNTPSQLSAFSETDEKTIENLYLVAFTRLPNEAEKTYFVEKIKNKKFEDRTQALEDSLWALVDSSEFGWNH